MNHRASRRFWEAFRRLPKPVQRLARKNYVLRRRNPRHPSLHFKEVKPRLWSGRVGENYRALAAFDGKTFVWFWIGSHDQYTRLLRS
jgi:hypothetical protein